MRTLNVSPADAEDALVALAAHLPATVQIGRPLLASPNDGAVLVVTDSAWWWAYPDRATRLLELPDGSTELTEWTDCAETSRFVARLE